VTADPPQHIKPAARSVISYYLFSTSIMDLMDLPAELLCQFIDLAVSEGYGGLYERSTVNLRLVNRKYFQWFAMQSLLMH